MGNNKTIIETVHVIDLRYRRPKECRNAYCGASCCQAQYEAFVRLTNGNVYKCPWYVKREDLYKKENNE